MKKYFLRFLASLGFLTVIIVAIIVWFLLYSGYESIHYLIFNYSIGTCLNDIDACTKHNIIRSTCIDPVIQFFSGMTWVQRNGKGTAPWLAIATVLLITAFIIDFLKREGDRLIQKISIMDIIQWIIVLIIVTLFVFIIPILLVVLLIWKHFQPRRKIPWGKAKSTAVGLLFSTYWEFLSRYMEKESVKGIFQSHWVFLSCFFLPSRIPTRWKEPSLFLTPFEQRHIVERLNKNIEKSVWPGCYISNIYLSDDVVVFTVTEGGLTGDQVKLWLINCQNELRRALPWYTKDGSAFGEVIIEIYKDDTWVQFARKDLWKVIEPNILTLEIPKGKILLGFYPEIKSDCIEEKNYFIEAGNLLHTFVVGTTQHGKDVLMKNFNFSILKQISNGEPMELHFFDIKESDGQYLEGLKSFGVFRYADRERFLENLSKLNDRMMQRHRLIGIHSNLKGYRKAHPDTDMKEVFIVVNELMDLITGSEKKEADEMIRLFTSLLSKGAGAGFKLVFMAQSMRKDLDPRYGKVFANITSRLSVKITNQEEAEIAGRGLPRDELMRLYSLIKYNAVHIDEGRIQKEFRAYHLTQTAIQEWIGKTFQVERVFENSEINDYYLHARKTGKISMKESMEPPFLLSRSEWDTFSKQLGEWDMVDRKNGKSLMFKNMDEPEKSDLDNKEEITSSEPPKDEWLLPQAS